MRNCFLAWLLLAVAASAQESVRVIPARPMPGVAQPVVVAKKEALTNYEIRIVFREGEEVSQQLQVVTTEGKFSLQGVAGEYVKVDDNAMPVTLSLDGTLEEADHGKCRLSLFIGRTRPYVTGTMTIPGGRTSSQVQQMQEGFNTTVVLKSEKPLLIQAQGDKQIEVTMRRLDD